MVILEGGRFLMSEVPLYALPSDCLGTRGPSIERSSLRGPPRDAMYPETLNPTTNSKPHTPNSKPQASSVNRRPLTRLVGTNYQTSQPPSPDGARLANCSEVDHSWHRSGRSGCAAHICQRWSGNESGNETTSFSKVMRANRQKAEPG